MINSFSDTKSCLRCLKTDRQCVFAPPQRRKQRQRTDTRVADLEKEVKSMRALFLQRKIESALVSSSPNDLAIEGGDSRDSATGNMTSFSRNLKYPTTSNKTSSKSDGKRVPAYNSHDSGTLSSVPELDVIDRGLLTWQYAEALFYVFINDLFPHYPCVYFKPGTSPEQTRRKRPILFLAVIAAASGKVDPHLYSILHSEVVTAYTQRAVFHNEKSLELVQAQLVTSVWYYPPGAFDRLKFYEYIHMATTMAIEIGLGTDPNPSRKRYGIDHAPFPSVKSDSVTLDDDLERRRTILACYLVSTGVSVVMRRPNMLRTNKWIDNCVEFLTAQGTVSALDDTLVAWVRLLQLTEEIVASFSLDDPGNIADLAERQTQLMLSAYEQNLINWKEKFLPSGSTNVTLNLAYLHTQIFIHEIAMHDDHAPGDLLPPYTLRKILSIAPEIHGTSSHVKPITVIISSIHTLLDCFLNMELPTLRSMPISNFTRLAYPVVVLTKLHISAKSPTSNIGSVLNHSDLRLGFYLDSLINKLRLAVGPMECRAPLTFLRLLIGLQAWHNDQKSHTQFREPLNFDDEFVSCWMSPPPNLNGTAREEELKGRDDILISQHQTSDFHTRDLSDLAPGDLSGDKTLSDFDVDWANPEVNEFLLLGDIDAEFGHIEWNNALDSQRAFQGIESSMWNGNESSS
ncbi:hypothetical protein GLAREA_12891 [Glarea lozoyensis ATCC 20868]|uniref:Xylanolytic transcriptional activator regulatory domain-containing protein n=1 Tax=Glarea lozoyensis (strain ATCC 20868 / MF5171) TaxID=1116229 RepID=S3DUS0_GLAL2|nr:uncharacterized protein GLAREA_12891 [Glarea lozoyensis ATCC 20868]EPE30168.1 hypothetical protein GLAREA_12891 [Glarea lozoyensis ATCC 20868]